MRQQGFSAIFILLSLLLIAGIAVGAYYLGKSQASKQQIQNPVITYQTQQPTVTEKLSPTPSPTPIFINIYSGPQEIDNFPEYPGSLFISKEQAGSCEKGKVSGFTICSAIVYTWQTRDNFDQVRNWYLSPENNFAKAGFQCMGGAGMYSSPRQAYQGGGKCTKNGKNYGFAISADSVKTEITFFVQTSPVPSDY